MFIDIARLLFNSKFFFNATATTDIYTYGHTLSLHDALPIYPDGSPLPLPGKGSEPGCRPALPRAAEILLIGRPLGRMRSICPEKSPVTGRSEEHTSELQSLMRISYAVFCLKTKTILYNNIITTHISKSISLQDKVRLS